MSLPASHSNSDFIRRSGKCLAVCLAMIMVCVYSARSQQTDPDLQQLIDSELAFAAKAQATDVPTAFLAYLDSAGMIFDGQQAVNGMAAYRTAPKGGKELLKWYPVIAHVSQQGDLGFTAGPFQFLADRSQPPVGAGYFFSVWKKNMKGEFKVMLDGGVMHSPGQDPNQLFQRTPEPARYTGYDFISPVPNVKNDGLGPWKQEEVFREMAAKDPGQAYAQYLAEEVVLLRSDRPFGKSKAEALLAVSRDSVQSYQFIQSQQGISKAGDLAYCFGKAIGQRAGKSVGGFFTRVWKHRPEGWMVVAEQVSLTR